MRCVRSSFYILDHLVFHYLVTDMLFFASINLITPGELKELQEELMLLLEKLERFTAKGRHEETFNRLKSWMNSLKRSSTLITVSGEKERVRFFNDQRQLVSDMTNTV